MGIRSESTIPLSTSITYLSEHLSGQQDRNTDDLSRSGKWKNYSEKVKKARQVVRKVKDAAHFLNTLTGNGDLVSLPVGIQVGSPDGSYTATMVIEDIRIFQNYTQLYVTLEIEAPILGEQPIIFYSSDIKFSAQAGIIGDATLALMTDFPINVVDSKAMLLLKGGRPLPGDPQNSRTYATIGCNGFESLNIAGEVIFSRDWMLPVSEPIDPRPPNRVTGAFNIKELNDPSQIFAEVDITPFKIRNGDDFVWRVKKLTIDLSEKWSPDYIIQSGASIVYETQAGLKFHDLLDTGNSWKGFYAQEISVTLPDKLTGGKDISIYADDLIIDHVGLSGYVGVFSRDSLLQFGDASLSGWAFSIDGLELVIVETYDWAVEFGGLIYIPVFTQQGSGDKGVTEADALFYEATIDPENGYLFTTGPATEMEMDLWLARATILPSTTFFMGYSTKDDAIITRAVINADIGIGGSLGENLEVNLPELGVRQLTVQNTGTPIELNTSQWELSSSGPVNVGVFEFGINPGDTSTISSATDSSLPQPTAQVDIKSYVKLTKTEGLTGQGGFSVEGEMVRNGELDQWVNRDFRLKEVYVQGRDVIPGIKYLEGSLGFYKENPDYGTGFRGALTVEMQSVIDQARMVAQFGTYEYGGKFKDYYFIDASATFDNGAPLGGAIYLRGIGGGFYRNMVRPEGIDAFSQIKLDPITPTFLNSAIGESLSGVQYQVDNSSESFGFKALAILSSPPVGRVAGELNGESTLFNANLELGMNFKKTQGSNGYGLQMIYFQGLGRFMGDIDLGTKIKQVVKEGTIGDISGISQDQLDINPSADRPKGSELPIPDAAVSAQVLMQVKLDCPEVHGLLGVYLNAGILYGSAFADLLIRRGCDQEGSDPGIQWHIFLGNLEQPVLLGINVPILGELLTIKSYLMAGNEGIPTSLPPPMDYVSIFDQELLNEKYGGYPGGTYPNPAPANRGSGFATGMALKVGTPPEGLKFLFMYATLQGGLGFDVMLANNILSECYESVGINGWYGRGQAWLYANAEIGAIVKLGFLEFRIKAFQAAAGAMLRVEGPNPFYGTGRLDAKLNLLGLVNAGLKFKVTVGSSIEDVLPDDCAPPLSPLDVPIIQDVYPLLPGTAGQYPANTSFIVELNYQLDQIITDPENPNKKYRVAVPMDQNVTYVHTTDSGGDVIVVTDDSGDPQGDIGPVASTIEFPTWFSIKNESLKNIPYTYRSYPNAYGGTNILVTPSELLAGNESVIIRPKAFILNALAIGGGYQYNIEPGYIEDPVYTFRILPRIEDYIIHESEVLYSYPLREMDHFLPEETASMDITESSIKPAYWITLNKAKPFIFENIPDGLDIKGRMVDNVGNQVGKFMDVDRVKNGKQETYVFSKNISIQNGEDYQLELVYVKDSDVEMILYQLPFKVSRFNIMGEKLNTYQLSSYQYIDIDGDPYCQDDEMSFVFRGQEGMGKLELNNDVILAMYRRGTCEGMGWISDHNASCNIYQSYDFIAGLINHSDHPAYSIELIDGSENEFILKSQLPAIIFDLNNLFYQTSNCGGDGVNDLPKGLINLLCDPGYSFPGNASGSFLSIVKYRVLFNGKEYSNEYDFLLNTIEP